MGAHKTISSILILLLLSFTTPLKAQTNADAIVGFWLTKGDHPAKIQIYASGGRYYGKIVWLKEPEQDGKPIVDSKNPDPRLQNQPVIGLLILKDFRFDDDEWNGGKVYDPESGKTYSAFLSLQNSATLKVRGYVGISLLGRTETWTRTQF
ncbi:DUF2147 domain-containing protein [Flavihumibacter petaseus]|uniref:DUF2147 domain-containing protein n=1 Tax=Flavihumibacter petaseus NBRC 106054 TaxID=1220578 RepID=A0A0E9N6A3_9BACT|nr:DUF2147 domain-containing protein [Flavihumibacter petaseus]GAO45462.1 hypothetical protein FPE01S_05_01570 [Flavihumibacter petaseus NBRC 106054]